MNDINSPFNLPIYDEILALIRTSKQNLYTAVNTELVMLYWNIGKTIKTEIMKQERSEYGNKTVEYISRQLMAEYGREFSRSSIFRMIQFFEAYPDSTIVASLMRQLSWTHAKVSSQRL